MGMFDTYGAFGIQIKAGACGGSYYGEGDECDLDYGLYIAYEGVVLVQNGRVLFAKEIPLFSKWGHSLDVDTLLDELHPMANVLRNHPPHTDR